MSDTRAHGFIDAARTLGVPVRALRKAIRAGTIPAPPAASATAVLPPEWLASAVAAMDASPSAIGSAVAQKVPAFARFQGTSAWQKYKRRAHEYARFRASDAASV